ncbi:MqnA/MqnD/SBP family protein [Campylobacter hyointestinalis]|uniref:Chorismate dehydratase n=2 Tax=Campylobacter hyointestinalis TaxID=198 RepID=A0AAV6ED93_CAMHY|nr:MqnA/MqnD/SBP family protein [Campylobacter hyointestinalis]ANE33629.1 6-amino-6-deoxyfutalosine synthase [Campylobacter hyointestinalis subsp. lawsonii CCUG 27631]KAB0612397.1 menaquinone via futalosine step 1 [Campylobacter hyointestinalis subsp. lawsonii]QKF68850.1 6-amino-6-deoxyfutalosine synthase [Campylobacter hyointestinalis subsp. lawsonii]RAZ22987.1 menaquinone via futalosine step 1 [Campylobacter hyointestinalis subsp. lawsonii]RAZ27613.1 menaquinone via futalosine step 1 [Campyl
MLFGKIDYLNLLPFHVFLKSYPLQSYIKKSIEFKKGVPSKLCKDLEFRRVDAAVISSIESRKSKYKTLDFGICSKKDVKSVLIRKNSDKALDPASMTSNMLCKVLGLKGEVIIGDRALKAYLDEGENAFYDMGRIWHEKRNLPFVFGRFSYIKNKNSYEKLIKKFLKTKVKIPKYIVDQYSKSRNVKSKDILWYLGFISYKMDKKEKKSLKIFLNLAREFKFDPK